MTDPNNSTGNWDDLKQENQFLKMKMMLEHGADIKMGSIAPPEIENQFLKQVMELERQMANSSTTTVFKRIGSPTHFRPVSEIQDSEISDQLNELMGFIRERGISLSIFSPNISNREIYRFIIEELFEKEVDSIHIPGLMNCFFYDDFHPDHKYENTNLATNEAVKIIFSKEEFKDTTHFTWDKLSLNDHKLISREELILIVNRFKGIFDEINLVQVNEGNCFINGDACVVTGIFTVEFVSNGNKTTIQDAWTVKLLYVESCGFWFINEIELNGINL